VGQAHAQVFTCKKDCQCTRTRDIPPLEGQGKPGLASSRSARAVADLGGAEEVGNFTGRRRGRI
jgi:hypothetical protein